MSVRARIDAKYGAPKPYYVVFKMRKDRALALKDDPSLLLDPDEL